MVTDTLGLLLGLPSVIFIDRRGHKFVGVKAYAQATTSPENVAQGFKRLMGTQSEIEFVASGVKMSPEEASSEIIRTLFSQAVTESGESEITGTIVTIPAAFNQMQSEATIRAANAAGLESVGLLQEPIAASMAAISQSSNNNGQFLVYDMGGGTFDLALVQSISGSINIVGHEGINMLGGRDFDKAILNSIVRPWLRDNFELEEDFQKNTEYQRVLRIAQLACESAKIELSTREEALIFAGDDDVRAKDAAGNDIYLEVNLTRNNLVELVSDRIDETIVLSRSLLKQHGYVNDDIDKIVFIGGPSKMPVIRDRVSRELGIPTDVQTDPMTAVAHTCDPNDLGNGRRRFLAMLTLYVMIAYGLMNASFKLIDVLPSAVLDWIGGRGGAGEDGGERVGGAVAGAISRVGGLRIGGRIRAGGPR